MTSRIPALRGLVALVLVGLQAAPVWAASVTCPMGTTSGYLVKADVVTVVSGNTLCYGSSPNFQNQEYHTAAGAINELGGNTGVIGSWDSIGATGGDPAHIRDMYTGGSAMYHWAILGSSTTVPGVFYFCAMDVQGGAVTGAPAITIQVKSGSAAC